MTKHRPVSPDFVSRQEASARLMLSLRQIDRLMTRGTLPRTKISTNRTGISRLAFAAYLSSLPTAVLHHDPQVEEAAMVSASTDDHDNQSKNEFLTYSFETTEDCKQFALRADRIGLGGSLSSKGPNAGNVVLRWHRDLGYNVARLEAILARWSFPYVRTS